MIFQEPMTSLNPVFTSGLKSAKRFASTVGLSRNEAREQAVNCFVQSTSRTRSAEVNAYPHQLSGGCASAS